MTLRILHILFFLGLTLGHAGATGRYPGTIVEHGLLDCFPEGSTDESGKALLASPSAAMVYRGRLLAACDKPTLSPGLSAVIEFTIPSGDKPKPTYWMHPIFRETKKYESATQTLDGKYGFLATGFSAIAPLKPIDAPYNRLLFFPLDNPEAVQIVEADDSLGEACSVSVSQNIRKALATQKYPTGPRYFNLEGLSVIPGSKLLLGIRQLGQGYDDFSYVGKIIQVSFKITNGQLQLGTDYKLVYEFDFKQVEGIRHNIGISSLEYDPYGDRLYLVTAYEEDDASTDKDLGAYLWVLPMQDFKKGLAPTLVRKADGKPLLFAHKMEGLGILGKNKVIVVADDDLILGREVVTDPETQFSRRHHQAGYAIVELEDLDSAPGNCL